jgi:hypothetical protein
VTPSEFKQRYRELLPEIPDDVRAELRLDEFIQFPEAKVAGLQISERDRSFLVESGLPRDCSPFLSFAPYGDSALNTALEPLEDFPQAVVIGSNGSGDMICLDQNAGGAVVYYNHDLSMKRFLMNSSLAQLAESICEFAAFMRAKDLERLRTRLKSIDPNPEAIDYWMSEAKMSADAHD